VANHELNDKIKIISVINRSEAKLFFLFRKTIYPLQK